MTVKQYNDLPLFLPQVAKERRDRALKQVTANSGSKFQQLVREAVVTLDGQQVTGEDIRIHCVKKGIEPHHHNAWGGIISSLVKIGMLEPTGKYTQMRTLKSHARETRIYLVKGHLGEND